MRDHLAAWSMRDKVPVASTVVSVFAENALIYADDGFDVRLQGTSDEVVVAVSDSSTASAVRRERPRGSCPTGLDVVSALCRRCGNAPTSTGQNGVGTHRPRRHIRRGSPDWSAESHQAAS